MERMEKLSLLGSVVAILLIFWYINPQKYINLILSLSPFLILFLAFLFIIDLSLRVTRWWILLLTQETKIPIKSLVNPMMSTTFLNLVFPARAGEVIRLYALKDRYNVRYSVGLSVIVVEQVINMLSLMIVAGLALGTVIFTGIELNNEFINEIVPLTFFAIVIGVFVVILLFIVDPHVFIPLFKPLPEKIRSKVIRLIKTFAFGLENLKKNYFILIGAILSSITIWVIEGIMIWFFAQSFINSAFELPIAMLASNLGNLMFMFPILPGAVLQFEGAVAIILSLSPLHMGQNAFGVAFTDRGLKTIILMIIGGYATLKINYNRISKIKELEAEKIEKEKEFIEEIE